MKRLFAFLFLALALGSMFLSCNRHKGKKSYMNNDTLSYVVGLNIGTALIQMDSTLNIDEVCDAIRDVYEGEARMSMEEARHYYLAEKTYFVHEKARAYQEQFLTDLSKDDRQYVRTRSGVTYKILELGDQSRQGSMSARDTVKIIYTLTDESGRVIVDADTLRDSYRNLVKGLQDVVKLAGEKSHFNAWLPSKTAYGTEGNKKLGVEPNALLNYDVKVVDIKYNR